MLANHYMKQAAQQYRTTQVGTADPARLVLMLYDGAIRFTRQGAEALQEGNIEATNENLARAQDIVAELTGALNFEAGEIAVHLQQMYDYIGRRLVAANVKKDHVPLTEAIELLYELRDAWQQLIPGEGGVARDKDA